MLKTLRTYRDAYGRLSLRPEFNPGPPSNPRRLNFYGHFRRGAQVRRYRINQAHEAALREDAARRDEQ
jgi:hypothetical protein